MRLSKRAGTIVTLDELVDAIGVDAAALLPGPLPRRLAADPRRRRDHQGVQRQPRLLRAVRPRPDLLGCCATPPTSGMSAARDDVRPGAARPTSGRVTCCGRSPSSRAWWRARPSCASRTASRATSRTRPRRSTGSTTPVPGAAAGRRGAAPLHRARLLLVARPAPCSPTASTCSGSPPRSGCRRACARTKPAGRTPPSPSGGRRGCASRGDVNALVPQLWSQTARKVDGVLEVGGVRLTDLVAEHGSPAYVLDEADFRARARAFRDGFAGCDVYYAGKAFLCTTVARWIAEEGLSLDVCSGGELAVARAGRLPDGARSASTATTRPSPSSSAPSSSGSAGSSSTRSTRSSGWPTVDPRARPHGAG